MTHNQRKPYCKVCHDAGKQEKDYSSHWVKSQDKNTGKTIVTCPTLLNTECRYCYELGHTTKFCHVLANKEKADERSRKEEKRSKMKPPAQEEKIVERKGGFALLCDDNVDVPIKEEYPALCEPSKRVPVGAYAAALAKPVPILIGRPQLPANFILLNSGMRAKKTEIAKPKLIPGSCANADTDSKNDEDIADNSAW